MTQFRLIDGSLSIEDALTCKDDVARCVARIACSTLNDGLVDFINAEVGRTDRVVLLQALQIYFVQVHASLAANLTSADTSLRLRDLCKEMIDEQYVGHFDRTQAALA